MIKYKNVKTMKSEDNTGNNRNIDTNADNSEKGAYSNTIQVGSVGIEGGSDNGASTLRVLKKKHEGVKKAATRRPML